MSRSFCLCRDRQKHDLWGACDWLSFICATKLELNSGKHLVRIVTWMFTSRWDASIRSAGGRISAPIINTYVAFWLAAAQTWTTLLFRSFKSIFLIIYDYILWGCFILFSKHEPGSLEYNHILQSHIGNYSTIMFAECNFKDFLGRIKSIYTLSWLLCLGFLTAKVWVEKSQFSANVPHQWAVTLKPLKKIHRSPLCFQNNPDP